MTYLHTTTPFESWTLAVMPDLGVFATTIATARACKVADRCESPRLEEIATFLDERRMVAECDRALAIVEARKC